MAPPGESRSLARSSATYLAVRSPSYVEDTRVGVGAHQSGTIVSEYENVTRST